MSLSNIQCREHNNVNTTSQKGLPTFVCELTANRRCFLGGILRAINQGSLPNWLKQNVFKVSAAAGHLSIVVATTGALAAPIQLNLVADGTLAPYQPAHDQVRNSLVANAQYQYSDVTQHAFVEFALPPPGNSSVNSANFSFSLESFGGTLIEGEMIGQLRVSAYAADGRITITDWAAPTNPISDMRITLSEMMSTGNRFSVDVTRAVNTALATNNGFLGIRLEPLVDDVLTYDGMFLSSSRGLSPPTLSIQDDPRPQVLFLNFDQARVTYDPSAASGSIARTTWDKPEFAGTLEEKLDTISEVGSLFSQFNVQVVSEEPTSGVFSAIHIGGTRFSGLASNITGFAEQIDYFNGSLTDEAFVFSDEIPIAELANTIAHEAGHILGLRHVNQLSNQIMIPATAGGVGVFGGPAYLSPPIENRFITQDSVNELGRNVGFADGSVATGSSYVSRLVRRTNLTFSDLAATLFDVEIGIATGDLDAGPDFIRIAEVRAGQEVELDLFVSPGDLLSISGKRDPYGPRDVFLAPEGLILAPQSISDISVVLSELSGEDMDLALRLGVTDGDGLLLPFGMALVDFPPTANAVPEPTSISTVLLGLALLSASQRRMRKKRAD
jgi:prepilin-type processing-associated H-X9-DG protein